MSAKQELRELKKEMKANGIAIKSCFNGGLTRDEYYYNNRLFALKNDIAKGL